MTQPTKYLEVTDVYDPRGVAVGIHSVTGNTPLPPAKDGMSFRWVTEDEARKAHPALFGIAPEVSADGIAEQIAALQALLHPKK